MPDKELEILKKDRKFLLNLISDLSAEQLNEIPNGFGNNIIWNLGHMIASQQGICYARGGHPVRVSEEFFNGFRPGTRPNGFVDAEKIKEIKELLFSTIDSLEDDYRNGLFANNPAWTNRYDVEHSNIEDSITFLIFHDGLHSGVITAMRRILLASQSQ